MSTRGIIIFAFGHPYYGEMAANLAASLHRGGCHITLFYHGRGIETLTPDKLRLFDRVELIDEKHLMKEGKISYLRAKVCLYDITPYHETIYFDADTLWFGGKQRISDFFTEIAKQCTFTMTNSGAMQLEDEFTPSAYTRWADTKEIKRAYKLDSGKLYSLNSEFIYFQNSKENEQLFKKAKAAFDKPKIKVKEFAGGLPDEFAFNIAMLQTNIYPHKDNYRLLYWRPLDKAKTLPDVLKQYSGMSIGGNAVIDQSKHQYNIMAGTYGREAGIEHVWKAISKKRFLNERQIL